MTIERVDVLDERVGIFSERIQALCLWTSDQELLDDMQKHIDEVFR